MTIEELIRTLENLSVDCGPEAIVYIEDLSGNEYPVKEVILCATGKLSSVTLLR
ncbi:hypothetical protein PQC48_gp097 [Escherichia phage MN05]|uniref:Uncharacterized protein n=1 Tax=Escherichia phage MN05 TaxID=2711185 RepID=A0A858HY75_9CAUD|nr:hypothetical protein PQC48_gp097 [Escherichia phage MN05]QIN96162.1 hypothetical protein MN05_00097 [Escherichia phage MN05]